MAGELRLQVPDLLLGRRERHLQGRDERAELGVLSLQVGNPIVSCVPCHQEAIVVAAPTSATLATMNSLSNPDCSNGCQIREHTTSTRLLDHDLNHVTVFDP
ncbi:hypothetical protein [Sorangium sp. So ce1078]|uniref:hypothetical protein n=1 Tax=Sorangium sp. So ce1078 TaxID=3133329 RepID=UPI003F62F71B